MTVRNNEAHISILFELKNIALSVGAWHDKVILMTFLSGFIKRKRVKKSDAVIFDVITDTIQNDTTLERKELKTVLETLLISIS